MSIWSRTRERITHFGVREEYGDKNYREVNAERVDRLRAEALAERRAKQENRAAQRAKEQEAYRNAWSEARIRRAEKRGRIKGSTTWVENFSRNMNRPNAPRQVSNRRPSRQGNWVDPFTISYPKPKKPKQTQRYAVVGGKAYPVAGTKHEHHKIKPKKQGDPVQDYMRRIGL